MGFEDVFSVRLDLGLGYHGRIYEKNDFKDGKAHQKPSLLLASSTSFEPSLTLGLSEETYHDIQHLSSFSNGSIKRERDPCGSEERVSSRVSDEDEEGSGRKKLRLTKEQSALLEECFKEHTTLNPRQKESLAKELNLRPRQVEVWFQNRRARTKLKQTEVDCEVLRKCCQNLTDENRRLHKELQELKTLKLTSPHYMQLPAATLSICPSCEKIGGGDGGGGGETSSKKQFTVSNKTHIYNPFSNPSAAC